jgi:tripartite ATP-independent transporter DctM subunit
MTFDLVTVATGVLIVCLLIRAPVFIAVLAGSGIYFALSGRVSPLIIAQRFTSGVESVPLLAVPFFVCAGVFMNYSGVTARLMNFCCALTAWMWGGLAQVNIMLATLMGGLCGSNIADAAMQAKMLVPEMQKRGMSKPFATVVTAFASVITPLIPPGIGMILYGATANVSIGRLFVAGITIGLLMAVTMMILTVIIARMRNYVPLNRDPSYERIPLGQSFRHAILPLCLPIIIMGGIRMGVFTPTEAGAVAIVYSIVLGLFYGDLRFSQFMKGLKETVVTTAAIMLIVGAASTFAWVLTRERVPQELTAWMLDAIGNKYVFLIIVNMFLLAVGMFIEGNAATIVLVPLLAPIARAFGIDDIQFAFVFIFNMAIGAITPPMGVLMFVTCGITGCKIRDFLIEAWPYFIQMLICLALITFVPQVSTWLVNVVY